VALVEIPAPYSFELSTERFRAFGPDLANLWHEGGIHRVVGGRELRIESAPGGVDVDPLDEETRSIAELLLGLVFDVTAFAEWGRADDVLAQLVPRLAGFRPPLAPDPFESLVTSITAQQVSLFAAFAIRNRLIERYGVHGELAYEFPTRARLAEAEEPDLVALGFSRRKAEYVVGLARSPLDLDALRYLPDDEVKATLQAERGLGEWTADWFLARHLARPQAWPAGDLGVRKAVAAYYLDGRDAKTDEIRTLGRRFAPFQNLTAHYLLTGLRVAPPA
jgi:DNA-3-methyladenine glycosylase II